MNWRQGFFRAWVALSALWVIWIGAIYYEQIFKPTPYLGTYRYYSNAGGVELLDSSSAFYTSVIGAFSRGDLLRRTMDGDGWSVELYAPTSDTRVTVDARLQTLSGHLTEEYSIAKDKRRWENIEEAIKTALIVPIPLFIFGWVMGWIIGGFRARLP